jgi:hypothetical protein
MLDARDHCKSDVDFRIVGGDIQRSIVVHWDGQSGALRCVEARVPLQLLRWGDLGTGQVVPSSELIQGLRGDGSRE